MPGAGLANSCKSLTLSRTSGDPARLKEESSGGLRSVRVVELLDGLRCFDDRRAMRG